MKVKMELYIELQHRVFELDTNELDRNYDDEPYAYWIVKDDFGYMHEINIDKDDDGNFLLTGMDYVWFDYGDFEDGVLADVKEAIYFTKIED